MTAASLKAQPPVRALDPVKVHATYEEFEATDTGSIVIRLFRSNGCLIAQRELLALEEADQFIDRFATAAADARAALRRPAYARRG